VLRREAVPTRHLGHHRAWHERLFENEDLIVRRPPPPATNPIDQLNAAQRPLRLKRKVKSRHKTKSEIVSLARQTPARKVLPDEVLRAKTHGCLRLRNGLLESLPDPSPHDPLQAQSWAI
jgi:hypothetical protein